MKIKLSETQWKKVIDSLNASDDVEILASAKPIERIINKINREITHRHIEVISHGRGWGMMTCGIDTRIFSGYELEFSAEDIEIIINALNESLETKRDEIDDEVVAIDANDTDEPINDIKEHLSDALEKANEVESLEAIREKIEKQQAEQEENEKDKRIAELTAKVGAQQIALDFKDAEIHNLKSSRDNADRCIDGLRRDLDELMYRLERYEPIRGMRRPPFGRW